MRWPYAAFVSECVTWTIVVPCVVELLEQLHDLLALVGVQIARRLVRQDERGLGDHGARDADELLLAAGELAGIEILLAHDAEAVERVADQALALGRLDVAVGERQVEVLVDREVVDQVVALEDEADVRSLQRLPVLRLERLDRAVHEDVLALEGAVVASRGCAAAWTCPRPRAP